MTRCGGCLTTLYLRYDRPDTFMPTCKTYFSEVACHDAKWCRCTTISRPHVWHAFHLGHQVICDTCQLTKLRHTDLIGRLALQQGNVTLYNLDPAVTAEKLYQSFITFGDVKDITAAPPPRATTRIIEFYDGVSP